MVRARRAAVQRPIGSIRYAHQVVYAEGVSAAVAMELVAAGAEKLTTGGAGMQFEDRVAGAVFIVVERQAVEISIAVGASFGCEVPSHVMIIAQPPIAVKRQSCERNSTGLGYF